MPQIINPYGNQKTMGDDLFGLGGVAEAFFGPKAATSAYTREKFKEQQRQNVGVEELATLFANPNADPGSLAAAAVRGGVTGPNLGSYNQFTTVGRAPDIRDPSVARSVLQAGGNYATTPVAFDANLQKSYDIAAMQSDKAAKSAAATADNTPISVRAPTPEDPNRTIITSRAEAIRNNMMPVLSAADAEGTIRLGGFPSGYAGFNQPQLQAGGVATKDRNNGQNFYITDPVTGQVVDEGITLDDGRTRVDNNSPTGSSPIQVPPGHRIGLRGTANPSSASGLSSGLGRTQAGNLDENIIAGEDAIRLTKQVLQMAQTNPEIVGPSGNVLRAGQTATDLVGSLQQLFGGREKADLDLTRARQTVRHALGPNADQIFPEIFSGNLSQIETLHGLLTYKIARALNKGGTLSNMDVEKARTMIGDPTSWLQGPTAFAQKMQATQQQLELELADNIKRRQTNRASVNPAVPASTGAPMSGTTSTGATFTIEP